MGQKHFAIVASLLLMACAIPAVGQDQIVSVGVKAGVPLTDALSTPLQPSAALQYLQNTHRLVLGASVELHLPARFGIELDILHKSFDYRISAANAGQSPGQWEFPLLAKFRILPGAIQPFIAGGVSFSRLTSVEDLIALKNRSSQGIVLGGGVDLRIGVIRITPEIRYTNWTTANFDISALQSNQNQATVLVGFTF